MEKKWLKGMDSSVNSTWNLYPNWLENWMERFQGVTTKYVGQLPLLVPLV